MTDQFSWSPGKLVRHMQNPSGPIESVISKFTCSNNNDNNNTGELGYDRLNGTRKIGPSYAKSVVYIWRILDTHLTGTKHIIRHMQKSVVQWSVGVHTFKIIRYGTVPVFFIRFRYSNGTDTGYFLYWSMFSISILLRALVLGKVWWGLD